MKGMLIISLCAFYTVVLFSCVALVKSLAILVMGQPPSIKSIDFKKRSQFHHHHHQQYDYDLRLLHDTTSSEVRRYVSVTSTHHQHH